MSAELQQSPSLPKERWQTLSQAAADFFYFQNHSYPRSSALEWVGNRHGLTRVERELLHRGVFSQKDALQRQAKRCSGSEWLQEWLVVDGHNVQITVESFILGRVLLKANDGALRDLAGQSAKFRFSEISELAMDMLFRFLEEFRPKKALFLFDSPMSHSGLLADAYRRRLKSLGIPGGSRTSRVPEREFPYGECIVASSDHSVLEDSLKWLDLASCAIAFSGSLRLTADFSPLCRRE